MLNISLPSFPITYKKALHFSGSGFPDIVTSRYNSTVCFHIFQRSAMFPDVEKSISGGRFNLSIFQIIIHFFIGKCHMKNV